MGNKSLEKTPVSYERFKSVIKEKGISIRELGRVTEIDRDERTIRKYLTQGEMPLNLLRNIAKYIGVDPQYLAGSSAEVKIVRKKKPYAVIETKEEFDHWFDKIYHDGQDEGFKRGTEMALAVFFHLIEQKFSDETIRNAQLIAANIAKAEAIAKMKKEEQK